MHLPPFLSARGGGGGVGGGGLNLQPNFQKGGFDRTSSFRGVAGKKVTFFSGGGGRGGGGSVIFT